MSTTQDGTTSPPPTPPTPPLGTAGWMDLTVPDAERVRAFYEAVVGWRAEGLDMGGYSDYCMYPIHAHTTAGKSEAKDETKAPNDHAPAAAAPTPPMPVAGICHARGVNADIPPVWLVYFVVADAERAAARAAELGGTVLRPPSGMGGGKVAIIRDPAGAVCAVWQGM